MRDTNRKQNTTDNVINIRGSKEAEDSNLERIKRQQSLNRSKIAVGVIGCLLIILLFAMAATKQYRGYKVENHSDTNYENTANYIEFCSNLLKYTPDGVSYINSNGDTVWTAGINMKMPIAVTSGSYAVVADMSGNEVYLFNQEGQVNNMTMPYAICDVDVASQGSFAVVLESETTNYINLYSKAGEKIYEIQTSISKSGYPLDITISNDAKKLFTSYINVGGNSVCNNLAAYNFGSVGQNANADRMVGGYKFDNEVVPKVEFVSNNTVVAFGTNTICIYAMKEKPSLKATIKLEKEARSVFYSENYIGVVQNNSAKENDYLLTVYDLKGNKKFSHKIGFDYSNIYAAKKEIIVSGGSNCLIIRENGSVKFEQTLSGNIDCVVPTGKSKCYVVVYDKGTEIIKLKSEKNSKNTSSEKTKDDDGIKAVPVTGSSDNNTPSDSRKKD